MIVPVNLINNKNYHFDIEEHLLLKIENNTVSVYQCDNKVGHISDRSLTQKKVMNILYNTNTTCKVWAVYKKNILVNLDE